MAKTKALANHGEVRAGESCANVFFLITRTGSVEKPIKCKANLLQQSFLFVLELANLPQQRIALSMYEFLCALCALFVVTQSVDLVSGDTLKPVCDGSG